MARFEDDFHLEAIPALGAELGYQELWEDRLETTSARLDSVGTARGLPCFVEVKLGIGTPTLTSIESKIAGALRDYADARPNPMVSAMKQVWPNPIAKPIIVIIGQSYSRGAAAALSELLRGRAEQWGFFWGVYELSETGSFRSHAEEIQWTGGSRDAHVIVKQIKGKRHRRNPEPALADFMARAVAVERRAIVEAVLRSAEGIGLDRKMRQGFVSMQHKGRALVRLYAESDCILLAVPKELTKSMVSAGFERHPVDGAFRWSRFMIKSVEGATRFLQSVMHCDEAFATQQGSLQSCG